MFSIMSIAASYRARAAREASASTTGAPPGKTAARLRTLPLAEVLEVFRGLEAPTVAELDGEYAALLLDHGSATMNLVSFLATNVPERWLCKAFRPVGPNEGEGHNTFQGARGTRRRYRSRTYVAPSRVDGRPSLFLEYAPFNRGLMKSMVDELRRLAPGVYLGVGRVTRPRAFAKRLYPFVLEGPIAPFTAP